VITVTSSESERGRETLEPGPETVAPILLRFVAGLDAKEAYHTRLKHGFALKTTAKVDEIAKTIQRTLDKWTTGRAKRLAEALSEQLKAIERSEVA
jgi:anthranilate phosphoribosyltransferase